jgi:hypothetical protein
MLTANKARVFGRSVKLKSIPARIRRGQSLADVYTNGRQACAVLSS